MSHSSCDLFDILRLVRASKRNSCDTGQINQSQIWASVGKYIQHNGLIHNVFTFSGNFVSEHIDSISHIVPICELLPWHFLEYSPRGHVCGLMVKSQLERTSCHDSLHIV